MKHRKQNIPNDERQSILNEIKKTQMELDTAYSNFSCATVDELIDSSIYDVNSIWQRYRYLIKQLKKS